MAAAFAHVELQGDLDAYNVSTQKTIFPVAFAGDVSNAKSAAFSNRVCVRDDPRSDPTSVLALPPD